MLEIQFKFITESGHCGERCQQGAAREKSQKVAASVKFVVIHVGAWWVSEDGAHIVSQLSEPRQHALGIFVA